MAGVNPEAGGWKAYPSVMETALGSSGDGRRGHNMNDDGSVMHFSATRCVCVFCVFNLNSICLYVCFSISLYYYIPTPTTPCCVSLFDDLFLVLFTPLHVQLPNWGDSLFG